MAMVPVSIIFELLFVFLIFTLKYENDAVAKMSGIGVAFFLIGLFTAPQVFVTETGGVLAVSTIASGTIFPGQALGFIIFACVLLAIISIENLFMFEGRDWRGRK